MSGVSLETC